MFSESQKRNLTLAEKLHFGVQPSVEEIEQAVEDQEALDRATDMEWERDILLDAMKEIQELVKDLNTRKGSENRHLQEKILQEITEAIKECE